MGGSASVTANGEAPFETWCLARDVYEANKELGLDDAATLASIVKAIDRNSNAYYPPILKQQL